MRGPFKVAKVLLIVAVAATVIGFVVMNLWNWLMPAIFHLPLITYWQALGLFVLAKLLFGGFHGKHKGEHRWGRHMRERWEQMSPEQREKLREGMRGRGGWCGPGRGRGGRAPWDREESPVESEAGHG